MDRPAERAALIELLDRDARVIRAVDVLRWPVTLGRGLDQDVVLDDPHVAPAHARLDRAEDGTVLLLVGESLNGATVGRRQLRAGQQAALDARQDSFQLGQTALRLRLPGQPLAPERPLPPDSGTVRGSWALLPVLALLIGWPAWLAMDPGGEAADWLPIVLGAPAALVLWCLLWALASKLFQHRFDFAGHAGVLLRVLVPLQLLGLVLPVVAAGLDLPGLWQLAQWLPPMLLALLVWRHALRVLPAHALKVSLVVAGLAGVGLATAVSLNLQRFDRWQRAPYMSTLAGPGWRWHEPGTVDDVLEGTRALEATLKLRVEQAQAEAAADDEDNGP